jgi:hypothetical protein
VLPQAPAATADMIASVLAAIAITGIRRLVQRGHRGLPVGSVLPRQLVSPRELPRPDGSPWRPVPAMLDLTVCLALYAARDPWR